MTQRTLQLFNALAAVVLLVACTGATGDGSASARVTSSPATTVSQPFPSNTTPPESALGSIADKGDPATAGKPDYPGIWGIWGTGVAKAGRPWYKGQVITFGWSDIEPSDNTFDWTQLDRAIMEVSSDDLYVMVLIYTGRRNPEWLYSAGVPRVRTDYKGGSSYPYYLNDNNGDGDGDDIGEFRYYFKRMIAQVAQHLHQLNTDTARPSYRRIIAIQGPIGASGDPQPYEVETRSVTVSNGWFGEGTRYLITPDEWQAYQREMFQYYYDQYAETNPRIHVLLNIGDNQQIYRWGLDHLPGVWVKYGRVGDRYQNNREYNDPTASSGSWIWEPVREFRNGVANRSRSEMDQTDKGWFTEAPVWNMYWTNLWDLHTGMDMHNIVKSDLQNPDFYESFAFFSKYAGYKDPRDSVGAWVALRDGLDMSDTERFPEDLYGSRDSGKNKRRYLAIAEQFAPYGARQNDPDALNKTSFDALNDVGWRIYPGNYQMWLYQKDPNETSQGLWRVGSMSQPYGRFARRFDEATGKNQMYFDVDDRFFSDQPLNGAYAVTVRIVYLDEGTGQWALMYDAVGDPQKTAYTVTKTGSGLWKEQIVTIEDGYFGNRAPNSSDLVLNSLDGEDDTFHMIEFTRETGYRTGYFGDIDAVSLTTSSRCASGRETRHIDG